MKFGRVQRLVPCPMLMDHNSWHHRSDTNNSTADFENKRRLTPSDAYRATHQCVLGDQCRGDSRWPDNFHRHIDWFTWTLYKEQYAADPDDNIVTPQRPASLLQIPQSFDAFPYRIPEGHGDGRAQGFW